MRIGGAAMTAELRTALEEHVRGLRMGTVMDPPPVYLASDMADWIEECMNPPDEEDEEYEPG